MPHFTRKVYHAQNTDDVEPVYFGLYDVSDRDRLKSGISFATGDLLLSKDGGTAANLSTGQISEVATSTGVYKLIIPAADWNGTETATVIISDQTDPPVWMDTVVTIETTLEAGHVLASMQTEALDLLNNRLIVSTVTTSGHTPTTTAFKHGTLTYGTLGALDDVIKGRTVLWTAGTFVGFQCFIKGYTQSTSVITTTPMPAAPVNGQQFIIV